MVRHSDGKRRIKVATYIWVLLIAAIAIALMYFGYHELMHTLGGSK